MGSVEDAYKERFRDYNTDGVGSSGAYNPSKSELRELGAIIESYVAANGGGGSGSSLQYKDAVRVFVTTNVNVSTGLENGDTLDGVTLATGDRVALGGQTNAAQNSVWVVVASGAASRAADMTASGHDLATVYVLEGTNAGKRVTYVPRTDGTIVIGTTEFDAVVTAKEDSTVTIQQVIGANSTPATGTDTSNDVVRVWGAAVTYDGFINRFRIFANANGEVRLRRFTKSGDTFTQVGGDISLSVVAGLNTFTRSSGALPLIEVNAGEYLGVYNRNGSALAYKTETGIGWYSGDGNVTTFTDSTLSTAQTLQCDFRIEQKPDNIFDEKLDDLDSLIGRGQQTIGLGRGLTPDTASGWVAKNTFIFRNPVIKSGRVQQMRIGCSSAGTFYFKRFTKSGDTFTQVGSDIPIQIGNGDIILNDADLPYIEVNAGEYLGFYRGNAGIVFNSDAAYASDPWYAASPAGNVSTLTDADTTSSFIQMRIHVQMGGISGVNKRLDLIEDSLSSEVRVEEYYNETVISASFVEDGLVAAVNVTTNRDGTEATYSNSVTFTAASVGTIRYDLLYLDGQAGTFGIIAGTERANDPTYFAAANTNSKYIPIFRIRVTDTALVALPLWRLADGVDRSVQNQVMLDRARNRGLLRRFRDKVARGEAVRIVGFGDSITAIQNADPSASTPNGVNRDVATQTDGYLTPKYGSDVLSAQTLYTSSTLGRGNDGGGSIHTRIGFNWSLVADLEARGYVLGSTLFYDNFGRGGKSSADAVSGGVATSWTTAAAALAGDLVVVALGMNERGDSATEARMAVVIDTFLAAGSDVVVIGVPRPRSGTLADWQYTNRVLARVAAYKGVAFINPASIADDRFIQALGFTSADICESNGSNHPGIRELARYGEQLVAHVLGEIDTYVPQKRTMRTDLNLFVDPADRTKQLEFIISGFSTATKRQYTFPNASGILGDLTSTQTFFNKTLPDNSTYFRDNSDLTKFGQFELSGISTATTRILTWPNANGTIMTRENAETISALKTHSLNTATTSSDY